MLSIPQPRAAQPLRYLPIHPQLPIMAPSLHATRAGCVHLILVASLPPRLLHMCREVCHA